MIVIFYFILISIIICTNIHRFRRSKRRKNLTKLRNGPLTNSTANKVQDAEFYHEYYRLNQTLSNNRILAKETLTRGTDKKFTEKADERLFLIKKKKNALAISVSNHHQHNCTISALCNQDQRYLLDHHHSVKTLPSFSSSSSLSSSCSSFTSCSSSEESSSAFHQEKDVEVGEEKKKKDEKEEQGKDATEKYHSIVMDINDGKLRRRDAEEKEMRKKKIEVREDERKRKEREKRRKREAEERKREEFIPLISITNNHHRNEHGSCQH